jgi:DNA-binding Xre family transcriptional regulator
MNENGNNRIQLSDLFEGGRTEALQHVGAGVVKARLDRGVSPDCLAVLARLSKSEITSLEDGQISVLDEDALNKVCKVLRTTVDKVIPLPAPAVTSRLKPRILSEMQTRGALAGIHGVPGDTSVQITDREIELYVLFRIIDMLSVQG